MPVSRKIVRFATSSARSSGESCAIDRSVVQSLPYRTPFRTGVEQATPPPSSHEKRREIMALTDELLEPAVGKFSRIQWVLAGLVLGFFLGFVDTLFIAALLGYLGLQLPMWFGLPTTFTGYFFTGLILGRFAPQRVVWEPSSGILACVILMMLGLVGLRGQGLMSFLFYFGLIPAVAVAVSYLGLRLARRKMVGNANEGATNNLAG